MISTVFGALIAFFFKSLTDSKNISLIVKSNIEDNFRTHELIHHKTSITQAIDMMATKIEKEIQTYSKEVDYKLGLKEKQIDNIIHETSAIRQMLHGVDISINGILTSIKTLRKMDTDEE
ncbi:MAG: hypothetical protein HC773_05200 [Scytonema sp. CRU_2_7]|nr:hypothetical protein [Scytonema sp. CRU_2_7]